MYTKFIFMLPIYVLRTQVKLVCEGYRVKVRSQQQKSRNTQVLQCETSIGKLRFYELLAIKY